MACCLSLLMSVVLLTAGCSSDVPSDDETADSGALTPVVQTAKVERVTLRPTLDLVGMIVAIPERTAVVSPQIAGWVQKLHVVEGQPVRAGDPLVELDARSAQTAMKRAHAVVAEKAAVVSRLKRGYLPQEIAGARQDADKAAATVDGLRNELTAVKDLLDRGEFSAVLYETKAKALKSAEAARASAEERVKLLKAGTRPEMIDEAQGLLDAANADLEQAQLNLGWCSISSPIDGVVVQLLARRGQFFDRAVPLATVMDLSDVFVQLRIPSRDFGKVQVDTRVEIQLTSLPGRIFHGQVTRISAQADPLTGNVVVFASLKNEDRVLRPGLSCQARIWLPALADVLAVPTAAVADHSGTSVVTVIRDGKAHEVEVETGVETRELIEIRKGLSPGDTVATVGGYGLPTGYPVEITAVSKTAKDN
ncbi:MAG: efflux RND transporter periplasmic adaptor subunit [Planctomycetes bacterium]|nr:efflux RND transporter periplasmic adaptor subunit [Planctomycetota bacterium]